MVKLNLMSLIVRSLLKIRKAQGGYMIILFISASEEIIKFFQPFVARCCYQNNIEFVMSLDQKSPHIPPGTRL